MDPNTAGTPTLPSAVSSPTLPSAVRSPHGYILSGKLMLSGIVVLFGIVLLILFLHLYVRWHVIRRHNRRRRRRELLVFTAEDPTALSSSVPTPPCGLDKDVLSSISIEVFSEEEDDDVAPPECAVCLNEFVDGEKVRVLPRCGHRFHIDCIDMWFFSHCTCPLCRCAVEAVTSPDPENPAVSESDPAPPEAAAVSSPDPEVRIEVLGEEPGSTSGQAVKLPGHRRISSIRRFLNGDLRLNRGGEPDPERGEAADRPHSPARPTTPSAE